MTTQPARPDPNGHLLAHVIAPTTVADIIGSGNAELDLLEA